METTDAFMQHTTVHTWLASLQRQTQLAPAAHQEHLHILAAFCAYVGQSPDAIIAACFRDTPEGKRFIAATGSTTPRRSTHSSVRSPVTCGNRCSTAESYEVF